jgi:orotate phosphoribosyltransferase
MRRVLKEKIRRASPKRSESVIEFRRSLKSLKGGEKMLKGSEEMKEKIEKILRNKGAMWRYQGKENEPHAILTSGYHSDGYINLGYALQDPEVRKFFAQNLRLHLGVVTDLMEINFIVAPSFGAIPLAQALSDELGIPFGFTEKIEGTQRWTERFYLPENSNVLLVEDVITTGKTIHQVVEATREVMAKVSSRFITLNGKILVACVIARQFPSKFSILALAHLKFNEYEASKCPLCKEGSQALPPKKFWKLFQNYI